MFIVDATVYKPYGRSKAASTNLPIFAPDEAHEQYLPHYRPPVYVPGYFLERVVTGNNFINSRYVELIHRPGFAGCQVAEVNITDTHPH